jgi:hypothetical protein
MPAAMNLVIEISPLPIRAAEMTFFEPLAAIWQFLGAPVSGLLEPESNRSIGPKVSARLPFVDAFGRAVSEGLIDDYRLWDTGDYACYAQIATVATRCGARLVVTDKAGFASGHAPQLAAAHRSRLAQRGPAALSSRHRIQPPPTQAARAQSTSQSNASFVSCPLGAAGNLVF